VLWASRDYFREDMGCSAVLRVLSVEVESGVADALEARLSRCLAFPASSKVAFMTALSPLNCDDAWSLENKDLMWAFESGRRKRTIEVAYVSNRCDFTAVDVRHLRAVGSRSA